MSKHSTNTICPRCDVTFIAHVHCVNRGCMFHIHVCDRCDREQAVTAFMQDHARNCEHEIVCIKAA